MPAPVAPVAPVGTVTTTEERITFLLNRIRERRAFAQQTRELNAAWKDHDHMGAISREREAKAAEDVAEVQFNTLRVLFPERFDRPGIL